MTNIERRKYPEKSWSISKMKVIENCLREYYYTYYGSHNGWFYESSDEAKMSWRLKKLTNINLMFGDKLHHLIKDIIKNGWDANPKKIEAYIRKQLNEGVKSSIEKEKSGEWDEYPRGEMLQEYYYGEKLSDKVIGGIKNKLEYCAEGFIKSKTYEEIKTKKCTLLEADEEKFSYVMINGVKIFTILDLLYIDEDDNYVIVDWKTGKESDYDAEQLMVYVLYVMDKYKISIENINCRVEYLLLNKYVEYKFKEEDIAVMKEKIDLDMNVINAMLIDKTLNKPKDKESFVKCDNINKCRKCKFKKMCL